jgi:hypothetical protein
MFNNKKNFFFIEQIVIRSIETGIYFDDTMTSQRIQMLINQIKSVAYHLSENTRLHTHTPRPS